MGGAKQFHPWKTAAGTKPLVVAAFDAISDRCDEVLVLLGHRGNEVAELLGQRSFKPVESNPDAPMIESIRVGLEAARTTDPQATVLLHPADHPEVAPKTLDRLLASICENSENIQTSHWRLFCLNY